MLLDPQLGERAVRRRRPRDDDLGLQQLDLPPHPLGARPHQGRAGAARAGRAQAHRRPGRRCTASPTAAWSAPGRKADLNVIDFDNLTIQAPYTRADLPTGASRILQPSTGYLATMVAGEVVRRHDEDTGARPGRLLRSGQEAALMDGLDVVVVGAGIGGLGSALALARAGHRVTLVERDDTPMPRRRRGRVRVGPPRRAAGAPPARVPRAGPHDPARPVPRRARRR